MESQFLTSVVSPIFPKSVNRRLMNLPVIDMKSDTNRNVGHLDLSGEFGYVPAPRETDPMPVLTHPGAGPAPTMVSGSCAREGRGMNVDPEVESRPEMETRQEVEKPEETQVSTSAMCEGGFGTTRSSISDTASQYLTADRPETTAALSASSQVVTESNPNYSTNKTPKPPSTLPSPTNPVW